MELINNIYLVNAFVKGELWGRLMKVLVMDWN